MYTALGKWNRTTDLRFTKQWKGVAQVVDDMGNPRSPCGRTSLGFLFLFVSFSRHYSAFVVTVNTYITPERSQAFESSKNPWCGGTVRILIVIGFRAADIGFKNPVSRFTATSHKGG